MSDPRYLTTRQVAALLGVSLGTVQQMVESGALQAWKTAGGHRRILATSVDSYVARNYPGSRADAPERPLDLLVIESDAALRKLFEGTLNRWEFPLRLRLAENGFDGLVDIGRSIPDILIIDLALPDLDSWRMAVQLRQRQDMSSMDIIVVGSPGGPADGDPAPAGITVYGKPVPFHELKGFAQARLAAGLRKRG